MVKKRNTKVIAQQGKKLRKRAIRNAGSAGNLVKSIIFLPQTVFNFLKSIWTELKLVDWLSRKETARWSSAVILTALGFGGFLVLADLVFFKLRDLLFTL